ncbi:MAG: dihydroorotate dehydrogenase [Pyrinomonadaceae bacterium]|jgi:dihydroorotate dehydrogenase|nr:dihydroorotate dehydrogenase [Pyrinomonadaceae bacterium]
MRPGFLTIVFAVLLVSQNTLAQEIKSADQVRVGVICPYDTTVVGQYRPGVIQRRAIEFVNARKKDFVDLPPGLEVSLIFGSDNSNPEIASRLAAEQINKNAALIIGSVNSSCSIKIGQVAAANKTPVLCPISTATAVTAWERGDPWLFRISTPDSIQMKILAEKLREERAVKYVALFYESSNKFFSGKEGDEDTFGHGMKVDFLNAWKGLGGSDEPIAIPYHRNLSSEDVVRLLSNLEKEYKRRGWPRVDAIGLLGLHIDELPISDYVNSHLGSIKNRFELRKNQWLYLFGGSGLDISAFTSDERAAYVLVLSGDLAVVERRNRADAFREWQLDHPDYSKDVLEYDYHLAKSIDAMVVALQGIKTVYLEKPELFKPKRISALRSALRDYFRKGAFEIGISYFSGFDSETGEARRPDNRAFELTYVNPNKRGLDQIANLPLTDERLSFWNSLRIISIPSIILALLLAALLFLFILKYHYQRKLGGCFISYTEQNPEDLRLALKVRLILGRLGFETYLYSLSYRPGEKTDAQIEEELNRCRTFVGIVTKDFLNSKYCKKEVGIAKGQACTKIIPLYFGLNATELETAREMVFAGEADIILPPELPHAMAKELRERLARTFRARGFFFQIWYWVFRMTLYQKLWPLIQRIPPKLAQRAALHLLRFARFYRSDEVVRAEVEKHCGLSFRNRIGIAAGFSKNAESLVGLESLGIGFIEIGIVFDDPWKGAGDQARITHLRDRKAIWHRKAFASDGVEEVKKRLKAFPETERKGLLIGCNIGPHPDHLDKYAGDDSRRCATYVHSELLYLIRQLINYVDFFVVTLNPNAISDTLNLLDSEQIAGDILLPLKQQAHKLSGEARKPVLLKLTPEDASGVAWSVATLKTFIEPLLQRDACDGFVATGSSAHFSKSLVPPSEERNSPGLISGEPLREKAINTVSILRQLVGKDVLIIGCGGITDPYHVLEFLNAGADVVEVFSGLIFNGPSFIRECVTVPLKPLGN